MGQLVVLGTGSALPTIEQENTFMVLLGRDQMILIDCGGSPYRRLLQAGLDPARLAAIVLTHAHPDHVYGLPALLMDLWLAGRREALDVYGLAETCALASTNLALYRPELWPDMYLVRYHDLPPEPGSLIVRNQDYELAAFPGQHMVPAIGLRVTDLESGHVLAYSGDTEPGPRVVILARGADLLMHEASGLGLGHSSAEQAGADAQEAGARRLVLIHYDAVQAPPEQLVREAARRYGGEIRAARDLDRLVW